jgi:cell division protein FtsW (lipid II flippase)
VQGICCIRHTRKGAAGPGTCVVLDPLAHTQPTLQHSDHVGVVEIQRFFLGLLYVFAALLVVIVIVLIVVVAQLDGRCVVVVVVVIIATAAAGCGWRWPGPAVRSNILSGTSQCAGCSMG